MKKLFIIIMGLCAISLKLDAATRSSGRSSKKRYTTIKYPAPNEIQCRENIDYCFNYYCFDKKTLINGVYSKCGSQSASTVQLNVEDCLDTRSIIKNLDLKEGCRGYTYTYIVNLLGNKDIIETAKKKNTTLCQDATVKLNAAKACWAKMISHDGSIDPSLRTQLVALCGYAKSKDSEMVDRFYNAGNYGDSNIAAQMDLELTGQSTKKRENWRQIVDGVLAGYMEMSELACGEEDYDITKINEYLPDSRTNLAMIKQQAQAEEIGRQTANRVVNSWFRYTDCVNSALPKGGLRWEYIENGEPDCRIICMDGYKEGNNSSECVEINNTGIAFGGFVNSKPAYVGEPPKQDTQISIPTSTPSTYTNPFAEYGGDDDDNTTFTSSIVCSKNTLSRKKYAKNSTPTQLEICKVFFPDCTKGNLGRRRWYQRNTNTSDEFFCLGDDYNGKKEYDFWIALTLREINSVFGTSYSKFGDRYASNAALHLTQNCPAICGGSVSAPARTQTTVRQTTDCDTINNLNAYIYNSMEYAKEWDSVLKQYSGSCSTKKLQNYVSRILTNDYIDVEDRSAILTEVEIFKSCACSQKQSSSNYEKEVRKACQNLDHKGYPIKNNEQKMKYCTETVLPAYCKPSLSSDQLKKCIDTFSLTTGNMPYNCTSRSSFNKCVWSKKFNPSTWNKSWYSIESSSQGKYLVFNKYNIFPNDLYDSLPFADFDEMFP